MQDSAIYCIISASLITNDGAYHCLLGSIRPFFLSIIVKLQLVCAIVTRKFNSNSCQIFASMIVGRDQMRTMPMGLPHCTPALICPDLIVTTSGIIAG